MSLNCGYIPKDDPSYNFIRAERFVDNCILILSECLKNKEDKEMSKSFDKKDVFSWANCDELRLATQGYVGNSLSDLTCNIAPDGIVQLLSIDKNSALCFTVENKQDNLAKVYHFAFFLPIDKVKEVKKEKKWRAFKNTKEFLNAIHCTNHRWEAYSFGLRRKGKEKVFHVCICGITDNDILLPSFGRLSMHELFTNYELRFIDEGLKEKFVPFGVLDESKV